jgi:hypothetical protein
MALWYIFWTFGIFFSCFGMSYQEKSGNPETDEVMKTGLIIRSLFIDYSFKTKLPLTFIYVISGRHDVIKIRVGAICGQILINFEESSMYLCMYVCMYVCTSH